MDKRISPFREIGLIKFMPGIAWFIFVLILTIIPGDDLPNNKWLSTINFDKMVHVGLWLVMVLLFCYPFKSLLQLTGKEKMRYFLWFAVLGSLWGLSVEFIQKFFVAGRSFDLFDWAGDSLGSVAAWLIARKKLV